MKDYTIQQGETLRLTVTVTEDGAETAELVAVNGADTIETTVNFDGLVADLTTNTPVDQTPGDYPYYVRITWEDGSVDVLTKNDECDGDCPKPVITVCELTETGS